MPDAARKGVSPQEIVEGGKDLLRILDSPEGISF
jgi:hypothetical protein